MTVRLRPLSLLDVTPTYVGWMNHPDVTRYLIAGHSPQTAESVRAFVASLLWPDAAGFAIEVDGQMVGTICLRHIDWISRVAEVGILVGEVSVWHTGVALQALSDLSRYAFDVLRLRRLWAGTCNPRCGALFAKAGWTLEGTQPSHVFLCGGWHDHWLYGRSAGGG